MPTHEPDRDADPPVNPGSAKLGPEQALRALDERLSRASEAAERLIAEAAGAAASRIGTVHAADPGARDGADDRESPGRPPPAGWAPPSSGERVRAGQSELDTLVQFVRSLGDLIPPELQRRLAEAVRELLLAVRALIDWYLERAEQRRAAPSQVQDIPIL
jgi:hypothetical protein